MTPENLKRFLFVCTGNTCRSVMAEKLLAKLASDRGLPWEVRSCGIASEIYFKVPPGVSKALAAQGVTSISHEAKLVSRDLLRWADIALGMASEHVEEVIDRFPEFTKKVHLLGGFVGLERPNIEDPIGQTDEIYAECLARIRQALETLIAKHGATS